MAISSSSDSDGDEDRNALNRILAKSGALPIEIPNDIDCDSESDSSGSDVQEWFRQIQDKFSMASGDAIPFPLAKPLCSPLTDSDDEDMADTMASIHRKFDQYQNGQEITDTFSKDLKGTAQLPDPAFTEVHHAMDESCDLPVKLLTYSRFPKSAQNFVIALRKNRLCQKFFRRKLIEIEAKMEENKRLKERIKCLMDFQLSCKRKVGRILCQRKDPRIRLISMRTQRTSITMKVQPSTKFPALCFGPAENSHVSKYKMIMKRFPVSFDKRPWSNTDKENLAKGLKQQYQEMLLLNSMNLGSDSESSMNPDLISDMLSNDLEFTPEKIRLFLPLVNWDRLASMYLTGRSGAECESRWLNCEDPLINHSPWTILEDKKLLFIIQERGIYNWIDIAITLGTQRTPFQCLTRYQRSLNPYILNREWTEDDDAMLRAAVEIFGDNNWQLVASNLEGRTGPQCSNRWRKTLHPGRRKVGRWSVDEDKRLKVAVMLFGAKNWNKIAQFAPGRTQVQCRERWLNCLDPSLKLEAWTGEEDDKLKAAIQEYGYSWSRVASCVPRRTDNQCWRRWKRLFPEEVLLHREARQMKRTVLISNFVDRESERPSIGPSDFSSHANLLLSECGKGVGDKKGSRKIDKSGDNSRGTSDEPSAEGESFCSADTNFADRSLLPIEPGATTDTAANGSTKKTRKRALRDKPKKVRNKRRRSYEENKTALVMVNTSETPAGLDMEQAENSCTLKTGTVRGTKKKTPSDKPKKVRNKRRRSYEENKTALVMVNTSETTGGLDMEQAENSCTLKIGTVRGTKKKTPSDKPKKVRNKPRRSSEENRTALETVNISSETPAGLDMEQAENSCTLKIGTVCGTKKKTPSDKPKKVRNKHRRSSEENKTALVTVNISSETPAGLDMEQAENSCTLKIGTVRGTKKKTPSDKPKKFRNKRRRSSEENRTALEMVNISSETPAGLDMEQAENSCTLKIGTVCGTKKKTPSDKPKKVGNKPRRSSEENRTALVTVNISSETPAGLDIEQAEKSCTLNIGTVRGTKKKTPSDKPKKFRNKPRRSSEENRTALETVNISSETPAGLDMEQAENSCTLKIGTMCGTKKKTPSDKPKKVRNKPRGSSEENRTALVTVNISSETPAGLDMEQAEKSCTLKIGTVRGTKRKTPSDKPKKFRNKSRRSSEENRTALEMVNISSETPAGLDMEQAENSCTLTIGTVRGTKKKTPSDNDLQIRRLKNSASNVDVCDDEDAPLITWLNSLAFEARSKRSTNILSSRAGAINQKDIYHDDASYRQAKRKRGSKKSVNNGATVSGDIMAAKGDKNESCYMMSNQRGISNQSAEGNDTVQLEHTIVDHANDSALMSDGQPRVEDIHCSLSSNTIRVHGAAT